MKLGKKCGPIAFVIGVVGPILFYASPTSSWTYESRILCPWYREDFFRIWLIEIQECWLTFTLSREARAGYVSAGRSDFSDVTFRFTRSNPARLRCGIAGDQQEQNKRGDSRAG
jgi:hypothetical protein